MDEQIAVMMAQMEHLQLEQKATDEYRGTRYPERLLSQRIHAIIVLTASAVSDAISPSTKRAPWPDPSPATGSENGAMEMLRSNPLFYRMTQMQTAAIMEEVSAYNRATR